MQPRTAVVQPRVAGGLRHGPQDEKRMRADPAV